MTYYYKLQDFDFWGVHKVLKLINFFYIYYFIFLKVAHELKFKIFLNQI